MRNFEEVLKDDTTEKLMKYLSDELQAINKRK